MSRLTKYVGLATLVAIVAALGISSLASAQESTRAAPVAPLAHGGGFGRGLCGQQGLDAAAKALSMTSAELSAQLWGGRTLADLADKAGVDLTTVQSAVQTACLEATKAAIQQAVKAGNMAQDQADWLLQGLDKGYWGGKNSFGFGMGREFHGRGGLRGFGRFGLPNGASPNSSTPPAAPNG